MFGQNDACLQTNPSGAYAADGGQESPISIPAKASVAQRDPTRNPFFRSHPMGIANSDGIPVLRIYSISSRLIFGPLEWNMQPPIQPFTYRAREEGGSMDFCDLLIDGYRCP